MSTAWATFALPWPLPGWHQCSWDLQREGAVSGTAEMAKAQSKDEVELRKRPPS